MKVVCSRAKKLALVCEFDFDGWNSIGIVGFTNDSFTTDSTIIKDFLGSMAEVSESVTFVFVCRTQADWLTVDDKLADLLLLPLIMLQITTKNIGVL